MEIIKDNESKGIFRWWMIPIALLFLLLIGISFFRLGQSRNLKKQVAAIRAEGYPANFKELDAWYPTPPAGENAADIYQQAFNAYVNWGEEEYQEKLKKLPFYGGEGLPPNGEPLPPEIRLVADEFLDDNAETLELLLEGATIPECRYPFILVDGIYMETEHLWHMYTSANLLALNAFCYAEDKEMDKAAQSINAILALSQSIKKEPLYQSFNTRRYLDACAFSVLEETLNRTSLQDSQLELLNKRMSNEWENEALLRAFVGERAKGYELLSMIRESPEVLSSLISIYSHGSSHGYWWMLNDKTFESAAMTFYSISGLTIYDSNVFLESMDEQIKTAKLPMDERLAAVPLLKKKAFNLPAYAFTSSLLLRGGYDFFVEDAEFIAVKKIAYAVLAVERYRLKHSKLPDSLSDLIPEIIPEIPLDPFDSTPIKYKTTAEGYMVYSIGRNRTDDGGLNPTPKTWGSYHVFAGEDIVFTVERQDEDN